MAKRQIRTAKNQSRDAAPAVTVADVNAATKVLREAIHALTEAAADGDRFLFPHGINLIHLSVNVKEGSIEIKVEGGKAASEAPMFFAAEDRSILPFAPDDLVVGQKVPNQAERDTVGAATGTIARNTPEFTALSRNDNPNIVFKDEDPNPDCDHMMTKKLKDRTDALAALVKREWPNSRLRVTEAWDENNEHGLKSVHYEARAVDLTTMPVDKSKLGRLGRLAVNGGFEWVFYEDTSHIHASMSK